MPPVPRVIEVLVGLIEDDRGRWLVNERPAGSHMAGFWEFPGGKREPREDRLAALARELREELGIVVDRATPFLSLEHAYPERRVRLDAWLVTAYSGAPRANEGQRLRWVALEDFGGLGLLPADESIVAALRARAVSSATT